MLDPAGRADVAAQALQRRVHPGALAAIAALQAQLPARAQRDANIALLRSGSALTVVTGQQLGLFGGPLFTLHKAATAVAAARQWQAETGIPTVPIFWLQSEDHDDAEIDHAWVPRPPGPAHKLHAPLDGAERASVGAKTVSPQTSAALDELQTLLAGLPHLDETMAILRAAWQPRLPLSMALATQLDLLLGDAGLVLIDPRHPDMSRAAADLHARAVQEAGPIAAALTAQNEALTAAGFTPQVHVRPDAPLSFVAPLGDGCARYRLQAAGPDQWQLVGGDRAWRASNAALLGLLSAQPQAFSTSALLRPLLQDQLLGCAAYIGGPAEIGYLAQIQPLYALLDLAPCRAVLRAGFTWLEPWLHALLGDWGLSVGDLREPHRVHDAMLRSPRLAAISDEAAALRRQLLPVDEHTWIQLTAPLLALDPGLGKSALHVHQLIGEQVDKLLAKYERALASRRLGEQAKLQRAQVLCWPDGVPQERHHSWPWFAARFGVGRLTQAALGMDDAFSGRHRVEVL